MATYVLNALIPPASGLGLLKITPATITEVKQAIAQGAQCFVGHPATAKLLNVAPNRGEAKPREGDIAYVLRLPFRPQQSGQEVEVREEDLEILKVEYMGYYDIKGLLKRIETLEKTVRDKNRKLLKLEELVERVEERIGELKDELKYWD